jgi:hypothetical protein
LFRIHAGALAAGEADYTHFTWWSQATFAAYSVLGVFGIEIEVIPCRALSQTTLVPFLIRPSRCAVLLLFPGIANPNHNGGASDVI